VPPLLPPVRYPRQQVHEGVDLEGEAGAGGERGMAAIFSRALELGRPVEVEYRDSVFFGPHRVPVGVRLA